MSRASASLTPSSGIAVCGSTSLGLRIHRIRFSCVLGSRPAMNRAGHARNTLLDWAGAGSAVLATMRVAWTSIPMISCG
jgi:hypothetical protein